MESLSHALFELSDYRLVCPCVLGAGHPAPSSIYEARVRSPANKRCCGLRDRHAVANNFTGYDDVLILRAGWTNDDPLKGQRSEVGAKK